MMARTALVCAFALFGAAFPAVGEDAVHRYLVDSRVHLAVVERGARAELSWHDTVTGQSGDVPVVRQGARFVSPEGAEPAVEAHVLSGLAVVVRNPPWGGAPPGPCLGVALD